MHRCAFVEVAQDDIGIGVLRHLQHDAHALTIRLVAQIGQAFEIPIAREIGNALDETRLVDHVRQFGDDDAILAALHLLDVRLCLHGDASAPRAVRGFDSLFVFFLHDESACGKVWSLHELHQLLHVNVVEFLPLFDHVDEGVHNFTQVMRRDRSRHAHCDTRRAVDQQIRNRGR